MRQRLHDIARLAASGAREPGPGARFAGFRLVEELGRGDMGVVWLATQEELGRAVALKLLRPELSTSPNAHERFRREARALARVRHRHIVGVLDFGAAAGGLYLAMEFVAGRDLRAILESHPVHGTWGKPDEPGATPYPDPPEQLQNRIAKVPIL